VAFWGFGGGVESVRGWSMRLRFELAGSCIESFGGLGCRAR
jgi:hypothetical protein